MARRRTRGGGRKADLRWTLSQTEILGRNAGNPTGAQAVVTAGVTSQTLMRVRGTFYAMIVGTPTVTDIVQCGIGLLVVPGGSGAVVTSSPLTDGEAPFLWFEAFHLNTQSAGATNANGPQFWRNVVDNKAMRVIRPDQEIQLVVEVSDAVGTSTVDFGLMARYLIAD